jgi:hypothetical protein
MIKKKAKQIISGLENLHATHLTSKRAAFLLIVAPACVTAIIYCFSILTEVVNNIKPLKVVEYEHRLAPLKKDLPLNSLANYVSKQKKARRNFYIVRYIMIPARIVKGRKPKHKYLVVETPEGDRAPAFRGYTLNRDYGNGLFLFKRNS